MPSQNIDLEPYTGTAVALFIHDPLMRKHTVTALKALGFQNVADHDAPRNYFQAVAKVVPAIMGGDAELVLLNLPPKPQPKSQAKSKDVQPVYEMIEDMYLDIKAGVEKRTSNPLKHLSKTVPLIEVGDYLREKLIEVLFKFRVPAAFFMSVPQSTRQLQGSRKSEVARENFQVHFEELSRYLSQYFRDKDELVAEVDMKLSEKELSERKKKYDQLMAEAERMKNDGAFEAAINVLKQAITVFPKDIEAYLESGRLYVRRKEYGRALSRFSQAEDLFQDAPAPNKEIANVRLTQVKEKIEAGADPNGAEIKELLKEAANHYHTAHDKAAEMREKAPESPDLGDPMAIGQEIMKWELADMLGPKHPAVRELQDLARQSTQGLDHAPLDQLSTMQCIALGLQALERGEIKLAEKYYFHALKDRQKFAEVCTEINFLGIRLRKMGKIDEAVGVYNRLIKSRPPNLGSVFWNMAIAFAAKNESLNAAGFAARCLYTDPYIAREKEFYESITPQLASIVLRLMRTLKIVLNQAQQNKPAPALVKMYQAHAKLVLLISTGKRGPALQLFLNLLKQAPQFTLKPEFHGDGAIPAFLAETAAALKKKNDPKHGPTIQRLAAYLKKIKEKPASPRLARHLKLTQAAVMSMEERGDQQRAVYYLGQALMVLPESYFKKPDFHARENLPAMARELAGKLKYVDTKRFPKA